MVSERKNKVGVGQHDDVVNTLLDLQARLRGEGSSPATTTTVDEVVTIPDAEPVRSEPVAETHEAFAPVTKLPTSGAADDRVAALTQRLARLESELSGVMTKIEDAREERIADRVVQLEQRLLHEIASQRADMVTAIESGFERLDATISEAWREAVHGDIDPA